MTQHEAPTGGQILDEKIAKRKAATTAPAKGSQVLAGLKSNAPTSQPVTPKPQSTAVTVAAPPQEYRSKYLDDIAPSNIVGRMFKFSKEGQFVTSDDGQPIPDNAEFVALCDQVLVGWIKFNGDDNPPDREMGLLYDPAFRMAARESLGDLDESSWEVGLSGERQDPWIHQICLVLQRTDTAELFTFVTSSKTGRRAVGNLLRHYDRMRRTHADDFPRVRLSSGDSPTKTVVSGGCRRLFSWSSGARHATVSRRLR